MKLKRITAVLMSAVLITGLAGCAGNSGSGKSENGESVPDEPVKIATKRAVMAKSTPVVSKGSTCPTSPPRTLPATQ